MALSTADTPRYASPPFDDPHADLILRSSDRVDFRVLRGILRLASPFFASMFEIGQTCASDVSDELRDGCPVIPVPEDSHTLDSLLRIIYPRKDPFLDDPSKVNSVMAAALKYEMEKAIASTTATLLSFVPEQALRIWAIAVRHGLEVEARAAADEMLGQNVPILDASFPPEMQDVHAGAYYRLLQYQRSGGKVQSNFEFCFPPPPAPGSPSIPETSAAPGPAVVVGGCSRVRIPADIICRSSDGKDFLVHKAFLAYSSAVIAALIASLPAARSAGAIPGTASTEADALPILTFEEDSTTLEALLNLSYPVGAGYKPEHTFLTLKSRGDVVRRYKMDDAFEVFQQQWTQFVASDPLRAYFLAVRQQVPEEARKAAMRLLDRSMEDYYVAAMESSPASAYRSALLYYRASKAAAREVAEVARSCRVLPGADSGGFVDFMVLFPLRSTLCNGIAGSGHKRPSKCSGLRRSEAVAVGECNFKSVTQTFSNDPAEDWTAVCKHCAPLGRAIASVLECLQCPSGALSTTLESLKEASSVAHHHHQIPGPGACLRCSPVNDQDLPALEKLYSALYDIITHKLNQSMSVYLVA
ncbi:hypothetical protein DAEQUDRAFT_513737 [Daedalea quercina L-15889]|uniref:BTB domain-containing protein n=1 Tax=Daedalea quercina L-15889 TaxID=1314783 RepID=A0A165MHL6_9APHY|nr:hypothetical protein DAEQUDRAFT_513737 [Daedalea quercina L-15889]